MTIDLVAIDVMRRILSQKDYLDVAAHISNTSDAEGLLDFMLSLLSRKFLVEWEARQRARRLMLKITTKMPVIPSSLFITGVTVKANGEYISSGGFGLVIKGELGGELVALKILYKNARHNNIVSSLCVPQDHNFCSNRIFVGKR